MLLLGVYAQKAKEAPLQGPQQPIQASVLTLEDTVDVSAERFDEQAGDGYYYDYLRSADESHALPLRAFPA